MDTRDYLTIPDAASRLDLQPSTLRRYCSRGLIRSSKIGWTVLIHRDDVREFQRTRRKPGRPSAVSPESVST